MNKFVIFCGPMFGSKTTRLLAALDRYRWQKKKYIAFKPRLDDRYSTNQICSHSGGSIDAFCVANGQELVDMVKERGNPDIIAVDEAFMIKDVAASLLYLYSKGQTILVSSLQLSSSGRIFQEVRTMLPFATDIHVCPAVCTTCGRDAHYTYRKIKDTKEIIVGGAEMYEPRCLEHYDQMLNSE